MRISSTVEYSEESQRIVDSYNNDRNSHDASYWSNDEINMVKREIKSHYKSVQNLTCVYCRKIYPVQHSGVWDVEHIAPKSISPQFMFTPNNLCVACKDCNTEKSSKNVLVNRALVNYPQRTEAFVIIHPHFDSYEDHIGIHLDRIYSPKSDKGRKTIEYCGLLRFSYESVGWDASVAQRPSVMQIAQNLLSANDPVAVAHLQMQLLMSAQIQLSETLLTNSA
ncbi:HNH endonuclease [Vibrio splendidus]|uniref:HNH endonuclease n=1 Tax=Vibrio splendidus TaxID=29497 RepID=UPI000C83788D|nr:HNH endonuclease domain-containing protein [Vibrio splendidus]PMO67578.1 hypothetical protein BCT03_24415 [Vibrio splendidus]